jgi:hypothetical protein
MKCLSKSKIRNQACNIIVLVNVYVTAHSRGGETWKVFKQHWLWKKIFTT